VINTIFGLALFALLLPAAPPGRLEFTRLVAHWEDYVHPGYLKFIEDAQPEIVQVGFYGADFFALGTCRTAPRALPVRCCRHAGVAPPAGTRTTQGQWKYFTLERGAAEARRQGSQAFLRRQVLARPAGTNGRKAVFRFCGSAELEWTVADRWTCCEEPTVPYASG
jgi:hypothetical protein